MICRLKGRQTHDVIRFAWTLKGCATADFIKTRSVYPLGERSHKHQVPTVLKFHLAQWLRDLLPSWKSITFYCVQYSR